MTFFLYSGQVHCLSTNVPLVLTYVYFKLAVSSDLLYLPHGVCEGKLLGDLSPTALRYFFDNSWIFFRAEYEIKRSQQLYVLAVAKIKMIKYVYHNSSLILPFTGIESFVFLTNECTVVGSLYN